MSDKSVGYAWGYGHVGWWDDLAPNQKLVPEITVPEREGKTYVYEHDPIFGNRLVKEV